MKAEKLLCVVILTVLTAIFFTHFRLEQEKVLIIYNEHKKSRTVIPVKNGEFTLTFLHSIEKTPVYELYNINDDNTMTIKEVRFYSLGTGLPFSSEGGFKNENGEFVVRESKTLDKIPLWVSPLPGHAVIVDGRRINFTDIAEREDLLTISAGHRWIIKKSTEGSGKNERKTKF
ncbi:DUF1850 domain-containing protein [Thermosediminibacter oceani]|uniref:RocC n=1 Tax=Thermosediminibacter oceani (strain ATCC BAA-1034 / DSM 16646 / JW/IW-1228P) TaxID=555079 RepID=D9RYC4_THEOJ|nr:DUF1850 domain-containing protein [Thermosediminibacter oceani]ADL08348.1 Domain of unknown function DUF1850 [Thermosediminibacter oceani DSM 16646]